MLKNKQVDVHIVKNYNQNQQSEHQCRGETDVHMNSEGKVGHGNSPASGEIMPKG